MILIVTLKESYFSLFEGIFPVSMLDLQTNQLLFVILERIHKQLWVLFFKYFPALMFNSKENNTELNPPF